MKIILENLVIKTKKGPVKIDFSPRITYFYGKMGAGKSTIARLIDYCLGNEINETPALQSEFLAARLELMIEKFSVLLEREKGGANILVDYKNNTISNSLIIPAKGQDTKLTLFEKEIANISDLVFVLAGIDPPKVTRSKQKEDSVVIRLSFRDLMWYCYLDQDHIDSSFFYLGKEEAFYRQYKSRDVLMYILGQNYERVSQLRNEIAYAREEQISLEKSSDILRQYLEENEILGSENIVKERERHRKRIKELDERISNFNRKVMLNHDHPLDVLKQQARTYSAEIEKVQNGLANYTIRIKEQERLKNEFITSRIKSNRLYHARQYFKDVEFNQCPQCGKDLTKSKSIEKCYLCKEYLTNSSEYVYNLDNDLNFRIDELQDSIVFLKNEKIKLETILKSYVKKKSDLDNKIIEKEYEYDSKYLAYAKEIEEEKGLTYGKIEVLDRLLSLSKKVEDLHKRAKMYENTIDNLRDDLQMAIKQTEKDTKNLDDLKHYFLDNLVRVGFPGIKEKDKITINKDFMPQILSADSNTFTNFYNTGSGGKKTIFKACFALALHRLSNKINSALPSFLIIDTPMKNISERENRDIFKNFYILIYELIKDELKDTQLIIIDKEYYPSGYHDVEQTQRHMTPDVNEFPPLIPYYRGH